MKKHIINTKYIWLLIILLVFTACNDIEDVLEDNNIDTSIDTEELPELTAGTADFSTYIAVGASFTSGFTDNALFIASQENSFPNILAQQFANAGGGTFTQPTMNDNYGGLILGGSEILNPITNERLFIERLIFNGSGPASLQSVNPIAMSTTDLLDNPDGPFNNMGVPGAKSFHLLFDGYGNISNLATATANPYFVRMATSPSATILDDAMDQNPTFFTLSEIGGNDVLGYATSGGDGSNLITPSEGPIGVGFNETFQFLVTTLTSNGAKGVVTNVPYITDLPHFTTVPYNPIPLDAATAGAVNNAYAQYNGGLLLAQSNGLIDAEEVAKRTITFEASLTNAVVIEDEFLTNLSALGLPNYRQATEDDLFVLPASSFIGTEAVTGNPLTVNGVAIPLEDKWVLTPEEQEEINTATDAYNTTIQSVTDSNSNIALVDLNSILTQLSTTGITFDNYTLTSSLVTGGAISLDGIHLTARGYAYMANQFLETIDENFGSNFIESGNVAQAGDYPTNYAPTLQ